MPCRPGPVAAGRAEEDPVRALRCSVREHRPDRVAQNGTHDGAMTAPASCPADERIVGTASVSIAWFVDVDCRR
jgi:hypothetical protein